MPLLLTQAALAATTLVCNDGAAVLDINGEDYAQNGEPAAVLTILDEGVINWFDRNLSTMNDSTYGIVAMSTPSDRSQIEIFGRSTTSEPGHFYVMTKFGFYSIDLTESGLHVEVNQQDGSASWNFESCVVADQE